MKYIEIYWNYWNYLLLLLFINKDYDRLARPVGKCLFFAGEATSRNHPATVAGAYLSGRQVAGEIVEHDKK